MSGAPYMRFYFGDYDRDTGHLRGALEHGAYFMLLKAMWNAGGRLPADDKRLARLAQVSDKEWASLKGVILPFFKRRGGHIRHKRIDAELAVYENTIGNARKAGNASASKKAKKNKEEKATGVERTPNQPEPEPESEEDAHASSERAGEAGFEELWSAYPHVPGRSSRPKSLAAWWLIADDERLLLAAAATRLRREGRPPPSGHPSLQRWLEEERWRDWLGGSPEVAPLVAFQGPADVRSAVVEALGEDWCRSYLDPCGWQDVPERALIPATAYAASKINRDAKGVLTALSVTLIEQRRLA